MAPAAFPNGRNPFQGSTASPARISSCHSNYMLRNLVEATVVSNSQRAPRGPEPSKAAIQAEEQAPIIRLVEALFKEALDRQASDIHLQPSESGLRVRYRIDGELQDILTLPALLTPGVISRLKIMADLDICERRIPQDGCIRFRGADGQAAELRMSTIPSLVAENVVLRLLRRDHLGRTLEQVGLAGRDLKLLREAIAKPDGAVLVTGPTGSGKTTTLYAALGEINAPNRSIFTAEDPVEGTLLGITQVQVHAAVGLTFTSVLRSLLRQDPDIIMVGEIRDKETVEIATKAALTGHLVLSTLHTNDTASTIERMLNMGVESYLITSGVNLIIAQRLLRRICEQCKEEVVIPPELCERLGVHADGLLAARTCCGAGCDACAQTGYSGRIPIFETMQLTPQIKEKILERAPNAHLKIIARLQGMTTLREAGLALARKGATSLNEVFAKTNEDAHDELVAAKRTSVKQSRGDRGSE